MAFPALSDLLMTTDAYNASNYTTHDIVEIIRDFNLAHAGLNVIGGSVEFT